MESLVHDFVEVLNKFQTTAFEELKEKWKYIEESIQRYEERFEIGTSDLMKRFKEYQACLPVLSFNGSSYDLMNLIDYLPKELGLISDGYVIKRMNSYLCISTEQYRFLDVMHYLAPGTSYDKFLRAYGTSETKGIFPYEWFDDYSKLEATELPTLPEFFSTLKNCGPSQEDYDEAVRIWNEKEFTSFVQYLEYYNNLDTEPAIEAIESMLSFYKGKNIDLFKCAISAPGAARKMLFDKCESYFTCIGDLPVFKTFKRNIVGGPSIVFKRYTKIGERIRGGKNTCANVVGYDANSLYLYCIAQEMPTGFYIRREGPLFKPITMLKAVQSYVWMDALIERGHGRIRHKLNTGFEQRIGKYLVDGFKAPNHVYEFNGCYWHGHPECQKPSELQKARYERTKKREKELLDAGMTITSIWECEFNDWTVNREKYLTTFTQKYPGSLTQAEILDAVRSGVLFGSVEVDIHVPKDKRKEFEEMSPLFCTTDVSFNDIGELMQSHTTNHDLNQHDRTLLVGGLSAKKILLATPLLQWYLQHGLIVAHVYQVFEFEPKKCFESFVHEITEARRQGDQDPSLSIIGDTMKLLGNSAYRSTIMDKEKHRTIKYVGNERDMKLMINEPTFMHLQELEGVVEIESRKKKVLLNTPIQIGFLILQYAKLHMLKFYYDFICENVPRDRFEYLEMDTDSAYMALADKELPLITAGEHEPHPFLVRQCGDEHRNYDKRTPGLFKIEATGQEMICLASKTYVLLKNDDSIKFSSKGIQACRVVNPLEDMRHVLQTTEDVRKKNLGFRYINGQMFSYTQQKRAFSFDYWKRCVHPDGIHTSPLDIVLSPWTTQPGRHIWKETDYLSPFFQQSLKYEGEEFTTLATLFEYIYANKVKNLELKKLIARNDYFHDHFNHYAWSVELQECLEEAIAIKHREAYLTEEDTLYFVHPDKLLGCGFDRNIHFMFSPLEHIGRNLFGKCLQERLKCLRV